MSNPIGPTVRGPPTSHRETAAPIANSADPGTSYIVVTDAKNRTRRIRVDVLAEGSLLIGAQDGVHDAAGVPVQIRGVQQTYNLNAFHKDASLTPFSTSATLSGGAVTVPDGGLAEDERALTSGEMPAAIVEALVAAVADVRGGLPTAPEPAR